MISHFQKQMLTVTQHKKQNPFNFQLQKVVFNLYIYIQDGTYVTDKGLILSFMDNNCQVDKKRL